ASEDWAAPLGRSPTASVESRTTPRACQLSVSARAPRAVENPQLRLPSPVAPTKILACSGESPAQVSSSERCHALRAVWYPGSSVDTPLSLGPRRHQRT